MKTGDRVWLRGNPGRHLSDARGDAIAFLVIAIETLPGHGTWYQLHTAHPAAQEIFGGWHTGLTLTRIPLTDRSSGAAAPRGVNAELAAAAPP
ncbi:hypothetical protein [Streptomyces alanosinicus]|uniref:Uncharacterized protein n=1 Tax=Streptomyces alanosinicus TaxID=68171 RepID=A0A918YNL7_9ACTN|nr:hypothetical protein [Streptomyces alanosinicus]GHE09205.1 hypothetical protein GCM10010339_60680 [Streptomyces alanosinicus]